MRGDQQDGFPLKRVWRDDRPDPKQVREQCPCCGSVLVSNWYYRDGKGWVLQWECWESQGEKPQCKFRMVVGT